MNRLSSLLFALVLSPSLFAHQVTRASVSSEELQANARSDNSAISGNGRYVVFASLASNLVPGDTDGFRDLFIRDLETGTTERIARSADYPAISHDGNTVVYGDVGQNLVWLWVRGGIFLELIGGGRIPRISDDGMRIVYSTWDENVILLFDRGDNLTTEIARGGYYPGEPAISRNGRYIGLHSTADDLVPGDTNGIGDAFVYDIRASTMHRISVSTTGEQGNDYSRTVTPLDNGQAIFQSLATNLASVDTHPTRDDYFVHDIATGTTDYLIPSGGGPGGWMATASQDSRYVAFGGWADDRFGIFRYDRALGLTQLVNRTQYPGMEQMATISADGSRVAFWGDSRKVVRRDSNGVEDVFVWQQ